MLRVDVEDASELLLKVEEMRKLPHQLLRAVRSAGQEGPVPGVGRIVLNQMK